MNKRLCGSCYENACLEILLQRGFTLVFKNKFVQGSEIDLVMFKDNILYFIEVRYKKNGLAKASLTHTKINRLKKGVYQILKELDYHGPIRISLAYFCNEKMEFIESIFH